MEVTWIVAANAGRARIFAQAGPLEPLLEVNDMVHAPARMRTSEMENERLGPTAAGKSSHNTGGALPGSTYEPPTTPEERESEPFARGICDYLMQGYQEGKYARLGLAASPQFLGLLRRLMPAQLTALSDFEIDKDYTQLNAQQLKEQLQAHLAKQER